MKYLFFLKIKIILTQNVLSGFTDYRCVYVSRLVCVLAQQVLISMLVYCTPSLSRPPNTHSSHSDWYIELHFPNMSKYTLITAGLRQQ